MRIKVFDYLDKGSAFLFLLFAVSFYLLRPEYFKIPRTALTRWLLVFFSYGVAVGFMKGVPIFQASYGTLDLIRFFPIAYIYAMLKFERDEFIQAIKLLVQVGLLLVAVGFCGLILAVLFGWTVGLLVVPSYRIIPYQIISLAGKGMHNDIGLYANLLFFLAYGLQPSFARLSQASLFFLIIFTSSRQTWTSFLFVYSLFKEKKVFLLALPVFFAVIIISLGHKEELDAKLYYRAFCLIQSLQILQENPLTGIGPGMFGDAASFIWEAPIYDTWPGVMKWFAYGTTSLDSFWPMVWGELGLIGLALYLIVLGSLFFHIRRAALNFQEAGDTQLFNIGKALQYYMLAFSIMGFAGNLKNPFLFFTYFALAGIYVSLHERSQGQLQNEKVD